MIDDLDLTIAALLEHDLPPEILEQAAITFATPDEGFPPDPVSLPALDLFLYDMRENRELRSREWVVELNADKTELTRERQPVRVDCSYLVTAWPNPSSMTPALDEHRLLGAVLQVLLRHPVLPKSRLQGVLAQIDGEMPTAALQQGQADDMASFWQALGGRPRAAFGYTVTIAVQPLVPVSAGPPVLHKEFDIAVGTKQALPPRRVKSP
jgi:hypothetical protein